MLLYKMGLSQSRDTINWDNIETDHMSSDVPNLAFNDGDACELIRKIQKTANNNTEELISWLNTDDVTNGNSDFNIFTNVNLYVDEDIKDCNCNNNKNDTFSDTSPFISSDIYNMILNDSNNSNKALRNRQFGGGVDEDEDDSGSDTTSSSSDEDLAKKASSEYESSTAHTNHLKSTSEKVEKYNRDITSENSSSLISSIELNSLDTSPKNHSSLSYSENLPINKSDSSISAFNNISNLTTSENNSNLTTSENKNYSNLATSENNSNLTTSVSNNNSNLTTSASIVESTISFEGGNNKILSSSINTSDINLISPYSN